ncbi:hypothetical protein RB596_003170 [Gaeumannomyces avenae]
MTSGIMRANSLVSPRSSISGASSNIRKERGAIAAQACDTCRSRKQRCDEQRPKCGTCYRFKLECHYREPQPTKKDKTLVEILARIKSLEGKFDSMNVQHAGFATPLYGHLVTTPGFQPASFARSDDLSAIPARLSGSDDSGPSSITMAPYTFTSSVHQMLRWPVVQGLLESISLSIPSVSASMIESEGATRALGLDNPTNRLPTGDAGAVTYALTAVGISATVSSQSTGSPLTSGLMEDLASAYFNTFYMCYPILDQQHFMTQVLGSVARDGFTDSIQSTLVFLVLALGEIAILGFHGPPVSASGSPQPSGVKGGTPRHPPGLALFNEARRRMGFNLTECSLEAVQVFALAGMYCEACSSHMEFWRMTTTASLACHALITGNPSELSSPRATMIRRCFWYCCIVENYLGTELGLPQSGLESLEDAVGPPALTVSFTAENFDGTHWSLSQEYLASAIALRRLSLDAHKTLGQPFNQYASGVDTEALNRTLEELIMNLEQWRMMVPPQLRWTESRPEEFPNPGGPLAHAMPELLSMAMAPSGVGVGVGDAPPCPRAMFTTDLAAEPATYPSNLDVQVAVLRSRYYYAKLNIYRQHVFRVLNHPEQMRAEDARGAAECLRACLKWPVSMSPTSTHKRLVPCLFFWTQNMLGMLVLLHLSQSVQILSTIRHTLCGEGFEREAGETVMLYIAWIRDLKSVDSAAGWAWEIVRAIYNLEE